MISRFEEKICLLQGMAVLIALVILLSATTTTAAVVKVNQMVSIAKDNVNMRSGPGKKYRVLWELDRGMPLRVIGSRGNWIKVSDYEKDVGWVYKKLVSRTPHLVVRTGNNGKRVNIRSGPSRSYKIVGQADAGVVFRTLRRKKGWVKVRHKSGLTGWIRRDLLWGW